MSQFYALMPDNTVKHIPLKEEIITEIKNLFINSGATFKPEGIEEDVFDGNIVSRNGENITYVHYDLPEDFVFLFTTPIFPLRFTKTIFSSKRTHLTLDILTL